MTIGVRRVVLTTALLALSLAFAGCWDAPPIEEVGLVTMMAIDQSPKGELKVTVSINMPSTSSATPGLGQTATALLRQASGRTLVEAIGHLRTMTYLSLEFAHLEELFVSEPIAQAGLARPLGYIATSPSFVSTPYLLVVRHGSAENVIEQMQAAKPRPEVVVTDTIEQARKRTPYHPKRVYEFQERVQIPGDQFTTAGVVVNPAEGSAATVALEIQGEALFDRDRLVGWLDEDSTVGWDVATGQPGHLVLQLPSGKGGLGLELLRTHRDVHIRHGYTGPTADMDISVKTRLVAAEGVPAAWWADPVAVQRMATDAAVKLTHDVIASLQAAQQARADVFSLGEFVRVLDPSDWSRLETRWDTEGFPNVPVRVHVHVSVDNLGSLVCPAFQAC